MQVQRDGHANALGKPLAPSDSEPQDRANPETPMTDAHSVIEKAVKSNNVMLFMKGTPQFPQCGFSSQVVQILDYLGVPFESMNVLADADIRQGIKEYANWPTIPQLYVKGEFLGGCDIVREMFQSGELASHLTDAGIVCSQPAKAS
jgi:monothiol glutaredoxin